MLVIECVHRNIPVGIVTSSSRQSSDFAWIYECCRIGSEVRKGKQIFAVNDQKNWQDCLEQLEQIMGN